MSSGRPKSKDVAGVRRISRWHPYSRPSPAAPGPSSESSSTSPVSAEASLEASTALSSHFPTPRRALATRSAPLELPPVVRTEPGLPASRHDLATALLSKQDKLKFAQRLVELTLSILSRAWKVVETSSFPTASISVGGVARPPYDGLKYPYQATSEHMPLHKFIHEVIRRSCTNFVTLQTALCYLAAVAKRLPVLIKDEASRILEQAEHGFICPPNGESPDVSALPSPLLCPRRTFLASILVAAKFLQDRSYTNKSWAKLTGLAAREVGRSERALLAALDYRLWAGRDLGPVPAIDGLDMAPVIAITATYVPEPERAAPQMLRDKRGDVALAPHEMDTPSPRPAEQLPLTVVPNEVARSPTWGNTALVHPLPGFETFAAGVDDPAEDPSRWAAARLVRLPPTLALAPTRLRPLGSPPQGADPDDAPSSSAD